MGRTDRIRAVLFDATGVLIEPLEPAGQTYSRVAAEFGVSISSWRLGDAFSRILRQAPPRVFPEIAPAQRPEHERRWWREVVRQTFQAADSAARFGDFDGFFERLYEGYAAPDHWRLRPGADECLTDLARRKVPAGIVSNFDHRLPDILQGLGMMGFIQSLTIPSTCGAAKPEGAIFRAALKALGADAHATLYVGHDPELDLAAAREAGLAVLDAWGAPDAQPLRERVAALLA